MTRYPGRAVPESRINPQASFTWTKPKLTKERAILDHLFIASTLSCVCFTGASVFVGVCVDI